MKSTQIKKSLATLLLAAAFLGFASSCHRGYGCPTNLKAVGVKAAVEVVKSI